MMHCFF